MRELLGQAMPDLGHSSAGVSLQQASESPNGMDFLVEIRAASLPGRICRDVVALIAL